MFIPLPDLFIGLAAIFFAAFSVYQWRLRTDRGTVLAILAAGIFTALGTLLAVRGFVL